MPTVLIALLLSQSPEVDFVKSYAGKDGQRVDVVLLKPKESNKALVRVSRSGSALDDIVFEAAVRKGRSTDYLVRYRGGEYALLSQSESTTEVSLPPQTQFTVKFSETATNELKPDAMLGALAEQKAKGTQALLARKEWPFLEKKYGAKAQSAADSISKRCAVKSKTPVTINIDWSSFSDPVMAEIDVWTLCAALESIPCSQVDESHRALTCRLGAKLSFESGIFTTTVEGAKLGGKFLKEAK
jgi:hypothetical protein